MMRKLAALAALLVMVLVQVSVPETAGAATVPPGPPEIKVTNNDNGNTDDDNGPETPWNPTPSPYIWTSYFYTPAEIDLDLRCEGSDRIVIGWSYRYLRANYPDGYKDVYCIFGPEIGVSTVECVDRIVANVNGPTQTSGSIHEETVWSDWHDDKTNPAKCAGQVNQSVSLKLTTMGQFKIVSVASKFSCLLYDYKGIAPNKIDPASCVTEYTATPVTNKVQVWCNSWSQDWTTGNPHTFTMQECTTGTTPKWSCVKPSVKLGVNSSPVVVLDDGQKRTATWDAFAVTGGVKEDGNWQTTMTVGPNSTPSRPEVAQSALSQKYKAPAAGPKSGDIRTAQLQWFAPSTPNIPGVDKRWTLSRSVHFDAKFEIQTVVIDSMDLSTGLTHAVPGPSIWLDGEGECESEPLVVQVNRARNFR